ncbi:MAG: GNAT family N-acetyltransferase [Burkholderiaceae bacterium]
MTVVVLKAGDYQAYRALMLQAYEFEPDAFTSTRLERAGQPADWWQNRLANPDGLSVVFGTYLADKLVGSVALEFSTKTKTRHKAHLLGMYVAPGARGSGAGRALLDACLAYLDQRREISSVTLTVTEGNEAALRLYRSVGFAEFGVEPMAVLLESGYRAKVHMWRAVGSHSGASES